MVTKFTYLGMTLSATGSYYQTQKALSRQGIKALFSLTSSFRTVSLNTNDNIKLFDSMISSILNYGVKSGGYKRRPS